MMSLHSPMHSSQMYTVGPAISFLTSFWALPQNEQVRDAPSRFSMGIGSNRSVPRGRCGDQSVGAGTTPTARLAGAATFQVAADTYIRRVEPRSGSRSALRGRGRGVRAARGVRRLRGAAP